MKSSSLLDLYTDYLVSFCRQTTATRFPRLTEGAGSQGQVTPFLACQQQTGADLWAKVIVIPVLNYSGMV